jgi:hypothetical protein
MIRVGLPSPVLLRMRLRAHLAVTQATRAAHTMRLRIAESVAVFGGSVAVVRRRPSDIQVAESATGPTAGLLSAFARKYERLIDLLCFSAQGIAYNGVDGRLTDLRVWFRENYPAVRPALVPFMTTDPAARAGSEVRRDDFEHLFLSEDVAVLINSDTLIPVIERTRAALDACLAEHGIDQAA